MNIKLNLGKLVLGIICLSVLALGGTLADVSDPAPPASSTDQAPAPAQPESPPAEPAPETATAPQESMPTQEQAFDSTTVKVNVDVKLTNQADESPSSSPEDAATAQAGEGEQSLGSEPAPAATPTPAQPTAKPEPTSPWKAKARFYKDEVASGVGTATGLWPRFIAYLRSVPDVEELGIRLVAQRLFEMWPPRFAAQKIAVLPLEGDLNGRITDGVIRGLRERCPACQIYERRFIDEILKEWEVQGGEMVNPESVVKLGNMIGAEAIIFGRVIEKTKYWEYMKLTVAIQMDETESGLILWTPGEASAVTVSAIFTVTMIGLGLVLLLILLLLIRKRKRAEFIDAAIDETTAIRLNVLVESINNAKNLLVNIRDNAVEHKRSDISRKLKEAELQFDTLERKFRSSARGMAEDMTMKDAKKATEVVEGIRKALDKVCTELNDLLEKSIQGKWDVIEQAAPRLKKTATELMNDHNRLKEYL